MLSLPGDRRVPRASAVVPAGRAMKPTILRDNARAPDGTVLTLHEHDGEFLIRAGGVELMSTRQHHSEERLAALACAPLALARQPRVVIGGLGFGFTLRAALEILPDAARVIVAELVPAVVAWNRDPAYGLAGGLLDDPRVVVTIADVADVVARRTAPFDAILLDVDNGAAALANASNARLYTDAGLARARDALVPGGCLAVWSAVDDPDFVARMRRCGFAVATERARVHATGGAWNHLFIGRRPR